MKQYLRRVRNATKPHFRGLLKVLPKSIKKARGSIYKMKLINRVSKCSKVSKKECDKKTSCKYIKKSKTQKGHCRSKKYKFHTVKRLLKL
tara:strand:- start:161 stop:430 length:270 start_codon:yes stop_codon:yes gene_type:complete